MIQNWFTNKWLLVIIQSRHPSRFINYIEFILLSFLFIFCLRYWNLPLFISDIYFKLLYLLFKLAEILRNDSNSRNQNMKQSYNLTSAGDSEFRSRNNFEQLESESKVQTIDSPNHELYTHINSCNNIRKV